MNGVQTLGSERLDVLHVRAYGDSPVPLSTTHMRWPHGHSGHESTDSEQSALNDRAYDLKTANVGSSSRDVSLHVATGSNRPWYAVLHVRATSMDRCCLVAHSRPLQL